MSSKSMYATPIPAAVFEKVPMVIAGHEPFEIRVTAFPGNSGEQMFAVDFYTDAERITPSDRRQKPFTQAKQTTVYFNAEGGFDGEPTTATTRYGG